MKGKPIIPLGSLLTALVGLGSAAAIYFEAGPEPENPSGYDPRDSKTYLLRMEEIGGKANVLAVQIRQWFSGLWHGRHLAYTVGSLSIFIALAYWFVATHPLPDEETDEKKPGPTGA